MPLPREILSKSAADAAQYLAETEAKVRAEGPLEKQALDFEKLLADPSVQQALRNTAIGAGIGGVGGLAMGSFGPRKKNPWTTAATGALLGAGVGGLGTVASQSLENIQPTQTHEDAVKAYLQKPYWAKLQDAALNQVPDDPQLAEHTLRNLIVRGPRHFPAAAATSGETGATAAGTSAPAQVAAPAATSYEIPDALKTTAQNAAAYGAYHPFSTGLSGAMFAGNALNSNARNRVEDFLAGSKERAGQINSEALKNSLLDAEKRITSARSGWFGNLRANQQLNREMGGGFFRRSSPIAANEVRTAFGRGRNKGVRPAGRMGKVQAALHLANLLLGAYGSY